MRAGHDWQVSQSSTVMGRSYWFECAKCGYRAKVSGRADRGVNLFVQTILCRDCRELYDVVTRARIPDEGAPVRDAGLLGAEQPRGLRRPRSNGPPPTFQAALNRLPYDGAQRFRWAQFKLQCPVSPFHRVQSWNEPDKCPRCGLYLEKNALPYRIWD